MNLPIGTLLKGGTYRITRFIGSGGFGCTYEAVHVMLEKRVAIKEFFVKDFCNRDGVTSYVTVGTQGKKEFIDRLKQKFVDEAKAICKLHHPGIVSVSDVFEENGTAYYVMDYIEGDSLQVIVNNEGRLPERRSLKYVRQVADALKYIHSNNRLHLDIKPGNIMIDGSDNAILIDFGASKQYDEKNSENSSTVKGMTPGYAPPEQMDGNIKKFMPATDIYSLGATLYKLLTGITPLTANERISGDELPPLPFTVSGNTRRALSAAMQLNKLKRPQSIDEFMQILDGGSDSGDDSTVLDKKGKGGSHSEDDRHDKGMGSPGREKPSSDRSKFKAILIAVCVIAGLVAGYFLLRGLVSGGGQGAVVPADSSLVTVPSRIDTLATASSQIPASAGVTPRHTAPLGSTSDAKPVKSELKPESKPENTTIASLAKQETSAAEKPEPVAEQPAVSQPFVIEEVDASFQGGGLDAFGDWVAERVVMPEYARMNNIQGTVMVKFTVTAEGNVTDVKVLEGVDRSLDNEAVRVVSSSPKWSPARQNGRNVKVIYKIPITFRLVGGESSDTNAAGKTAAASTTGSINGHEWVDLGLSVKWATCNVGASSPSDYGGYYAWGETRTKSEYTEDNSSTNGVNLGDISGNSRYDAARANWGGTWRLPTEVEIWELIGSCTWTWTKQGGHNGYRVTGPNGSSIFLPAAGCRLGSSLYDIEGFGSYWCSTPESDYRRSSSLGFDNSLHDCRWYYRYNGLSVRPVSD